MSDVLLLPGKFFDGTLDDYNELDNWQSGLNERQISFLLDIGVYNDAIRGNLIIAALLADFPESDVIKLLDAMDFVLSMIEKSEADQSYYSWRDTKHPYFKGSL